MNIVDREGSLWTLEGMPKLIFRFLQFLILTCNDSSHTLSRSLCSPGVSAVSTLTPTPVLAFVYRLAMTADGPVCISGDISSSNGWGGIFGRLTCITGMKIRFSSVGWWFCSRCAWWACWSQYALSSNEKLWCCKDATGVVDVVDAVGDSKP